MILIADSGATKTDWSLVSANAEISRDQSFGLNAFHKTDAELLQIVKGLKFPFDEIQEIYFYGAGCEAKPQQEKIKKVLSSLFSKTDIFVESDILGAARSLCGNQAGIIGILGTGSNACFYDGYKITAQTVTLGWVLGDEGSGNYFGRRLIQDFCYDLMPTSVAEKLKKEHQLSIQSVKENIYNQGSPVHFFASFSRFLVQNLDQGYCKRLVEDSFDLFFQRHVNTLANSAYKDIHFTGSVAFHFKEILKQVAHKYGYNLRNNNPKPIEGLLRYHTSSNNI